MSVKPPETLAGPSLNLCLDKGYDYDGPRQIAYDYNLTAHIRCRGEESKTLPEDPNHKPRRWVVERPGSTASDDCSFAGRRSPRTTKLCSSSPVASSPGSKLPYWDRLLVTVAGSLLGRRPRPRGFRLSETCSPFCRRFSHSAMIFLKRAWLPPPEPRRDCRRQKFVSHAARG